MRANTPKGEIPFPLDEGRAFARARARGRTLCLERSDLARRRAIRHVGRPRRKVLLHPRWEVLA
jgi:hypothetical protein